MTTGAGFGCWCLNALANAVSSGVNGTVAVRITSTRGRHNREASFCWPLCLSARRILRTRRVRPPCALNSAPSQWRPRQRPTFDGVSWTDERPLMQGPGVKPYFKYASDGHETIHIAFTDGHPRGEEANSIYYICYRGGAFFRADGSEVMDLVELPFGPSDADKVYDGAEAGGRSRIWDIALDESVRPVLVYAVFPAANDHRYRYARWDGAEWLDYEITSAGPSFPDKQSRRRGPSGQPLHYLSGRAVVEWQLR
ncbi:MAG: BNR-4 repeat-containing protein [Candidatus Eisenbacteria bacterium]